MGSYFQLSNDFYEELDPEDLHLDLKLWMKSTHPNFRRRLEDLTTDVKSLKDSLKKLTESIPNQIQNAFQELNKEV
jgi:GTP-dependent phosphoenolpyruvate carboxykinase